MLPCIQLQGWWQWMGHSIRVIFGIFDRTFDGDGKAGRATSAATKLGSAAPNGWTAWAARRKRSTASARVAHSSAPAYWTARATDAPAWELASASPLAGMTRSLHGADRSAGDEGRVPFSPMRPPRKHCGSSMMRSEWRSARAMRAAFAWCRGSTWATSGYAQERWDDAWQDYQAHSAWHGGAASTAGRKLRQLGRPWRRLPDASTSLCTSSTAWQ